MSVKLIVALAGLVIIGLIVWYRWGNDDFDEDVDIDDTTAAFNFLKNRICVFLHGLNFLSFRVITAPVITN